MNKEEKLSALAILEKKQLESVAILKKAIIEESHTDPLRIKGIIGGYYQSLSSTLTIEMIKNGRSEIADKVFTTNKTAIDIQLRDIKDHKSNSLPRN